jgi:hypothetical protein
MMDERPDFVVNGVIEKYAEHPIPIKVGELARIFFVNAGPNRTSSFHVVGTVFSSVYRSGNPANLFPGCRVLKWGRATALSSSSVYTSQATTHSSIMQLRAPTRERSVSSAQPLTGVGEICDNSVP